ncbi:MAG: hypothetical protein LAP13_26045 [Acidobacteriia bacterium]|nr:hypothetical protein [Terriglobia bacterium]
MKRIARCFALAVSVTLSAFPAYSQNLRLRAGTLVHCTIAEPNFSSRTAEIGEPLICSAQPLREFGRLALPRGSYFTGRLADSRDPGRLVGKGWLKLDFDRLILPDAEIPMATKVVAVRRYSVDAEGKILGRGHPKRDALGWTVPILWPAKVITLPARGPYPALRGETPVTLRLLDDITIPCTSRSPCR